LKKQNAMEDKTHNLKKREAITRKKNNNETADWWHDLSTTQKEGIERGLADIDEGRTISHKNIKEKYDL
jgi:predicted transcriptional regulator